MCGLFVCLLGLFGLFMRLFGLVWFVPIFLCAHVCLLLDLTSGLVGFCVRLSCFGLFPFSWVSMLVGRRVISLSLGPSRPRQVVPLAAPKAPADPSTQIQVRGVAHASARMRRGGGSWAYKSDRTGGVAIKKARNNFVSNVSFLG